MLLLTEGDKGDDDNRTEILFDRLMLMELREIMGKLDPKSYAELRSYNEPPKVNQCSIKLWNCSKDLLNVKIIVKMNRPVVYSYLIRFAKRHAGSDRLVTELLPVKCFAPIIVKTMSNT